MTEKILIHKLTGNLVIKTNLLHGDKIAFVVLDAGEFYFVDWKDEWFEELGEL